MTTAQQLIDYLTTLPPDTEIEVLEAYSRHYDTCTMWVPLDLNHPYSDSMDLIAFGGGPYKGKTILFLGVE